MPADLVLDEIIRRRKHIQTGISDGSLLSIEIICREFFCPTLTASRYWLEIKTRAYIFVRNCRQPYGYQNLEAKRSQFQKLQLHALQGSQLPPIPG